MKNNFYATCEYCGANLDPGEHCDCEESKSYTLQRIQKIEQQSTQSDKTDSHSDNK